MQTTSSQTGPNPANKEQGELLLNIIQSTCQGFCMWAYRFPAPFHAVRPKSGGPPLEKGQGTAIVTGAISIIFGVSAALYTSSCLEPACPASPCSVPHAAQFCWHWRRSSITSLPSSRAQTLLHSKRSFRHGEPLSVGTGAVPCAGATVGYPGESAGASSSRSL